jgi:menaquinol-cytochrome c reductase iron-sulfur subunit
MPDTIPQRRRFLSACTVGLLALLSGLVAGPVVAFVTSPLRKRPGAIEPVGDYSDAGPLDALPLGQWKLLPIEIFRQDGWAKVHESRSVWVLRNGNTTGEIRVFSPICTHLGCPITWASGTSDFRCPCHGGVFAATGEHIAGPPPRGLDPLDFQVRDNRLWVRWQDFKISVPERVLVRM